MNDIPAIIAEVRRLNSEATPGPVKWNDDEGEFVDSNGRTILLGQGTFEGNHPIVGDEADLKCFAYFRNVCPQLADEAERLQQELEKSRDAFNDLHATLWKRIDETRDKGRTDLLKISQLQEEMATNKKAREDLRTELNLMRQAAEHRNRELDALHYVWCSGGCEKGVHRYCSNPEEITEETVQIIERQAKRLREWLTTRQAKKAEST